MTREIFLKRLEELLYDLPEEERISALEYYEDYFEEAGPDMELQVMKELGSPERIAAIIKTNLLREVENRSIDGEFTELGYSAPEFDEKKNEIVLGSERLHEQEEGDKRQEEMRFKKIRPIRTREKVLITKECMNILMKNSQRKIILFYIIRNGKERIWFFYFLSFLLGYR